MLDTVAIQNAIDEFSASQPEESYHVHIPAKKERGYLGLSALGGECKRAVWFDFRKVASKSFPPRMLRLFRRGDVQEFQFNFLLRGIGFTVYERDENGKQFKVTDFEGHLSGSMDGVGEAPDKYWIAGTTPIPFLIEYKTYNTKRFAKLQKEGVKVSDPKYYKQMIGYMGYNNLEAALFCAVNKDNDELYFEWVKFSKQEFKRLVNLAEEILSSQSPPDRISNISSWWQCTYCDFKPQCHEGKASLKSCRSCRWAEPSLEAMWKCTKGKEYGTVCPQYKDIAHHG